MVAAAPGADRPTRWRSWCKESAFNKLGLTPSAHALRAASAALALASPFVVGVVAGLVVGGGVEAVAVVSGVVVAE